MTYVTLVATGMGIPVEGIDWWRHRDLGAEPPPSDAEGEQEYARLFPDDDRYDAYSTFDDLHDEARTRAVLDLFNAQLRYGIGYATSWERRQAWFHHRADEAIGRRRARRTMAFVGYMHRPELEAHLVGKGLRSVDPRGMRVPVEDRPVPAEVLASWREGITRLRAVSSVNEKVVASMRKKADTWQVAVDGQGRCCAR